MFHFCQVVKISGQIANTIDSFIERCHLNVNFFFKVHCGTHDVTKECGYCIAPKLACRRGVLFCVFQARGGKREASSGRENESRVRSPQRGINNNNTCSVMMKDQSRNIWKPYPKLWHLLFMFYVN